MNGDDEFKRQLAEIRDTTRDLITSVLLDRWPRSGAIVDFGIDSQEHYEALYYPIRNAEIMPQELDSALGHGEHLTALALASPSNPHKEIRFATSWDGVFGRDMPDDALSEETKLMRSLDRLVEQSSSGDGLPPMSGDPSDRPRCRDDQARDRVSTKDKNRDR